MQQLSLTDPDYQLNPFERPMPYPPGTRVTFRGQPARVVQGMTNDTNGNYVPYTAAGTVSIRYRYKGVLTTAQAPIGWVSDPVQAPKPTLPQLDYAITLRRPWPYAITNLGKDVENRTWHCFKAPGAWLAIHAGKTYEFSAESLLAEEFVSHSIPQMAEHPTGIVAIAQFLGNVTTSESMWFTGPIGWQLGEVRLLAKPVECRGRQGLWKIEQALKEAVYRELRS